MKYFYVKREADGAVIDIPADQLQETLKRGGFKLMPEITLNAGLPVDTSVTFNCPLCDFTTKFETGLKVHKAKHK